MSSIWKKPIFRWGIAALILAGLVYWFENGTKSDALLEPQSVRITAAPLPLPKGNADIPSALSLRITHVWDLSAPSPDFGGFSALQVSGGFLTLLSDTAALVRIAQGDKLKLWRGAITLPPAECGIKAIAEERDIESITTDPKTGTLWLGFEHRNGVCRIASPEQGGIRFRALPEMERWPKSGGPEAMARLSDGAFLIFSERPRGNGPVGDMLYVDRDPTDPEAKVTSMRYRPPTGYRPVDAAQLPDGRVLVLNRRFQFPFQFSSRLSIIDKPEPKEGQIVGGPILARFDGKALGENFEGLAIDDDGESLTLWLVADDNFMPIQRTLLMRMVWPKVARLETNLKPR
jgi:hypothetical protein